VKIVAAQQPVVTKFYILL